MANPQHVALARRGPYALARWREQQWRRRGRLDLSGAALSGVKLPGADLARDELTAIDLTNADLRRADLSGANLPDSYLSRANLRWGNLRDTQLQRAALNRVNLNGGQLPNADLRGADLSFADLSNADLSGANLSAADLREADLSLADLSGAQLTAARLTGTRLNLANLTGADLRRAALIRPHMDGALLSAARLEMTLFGDCDLRRVLGLDTLQHHGPSIIGLDTLARSQGSLPPAFLRQAGVAESLIAWQEHLALLPPAFSRILLVGSRQDAAFIDRLERDLRTDGFPCWQLLVDDEAAFAAAEDGESLLSRVIYYDQPVLICSAAALGSPYGWRSFDQIARNKAGPTVSVSLDNQLNNPEDPLAAALRRGVVIDFPAEPDLDTESYGGSLARLRAALTGPRETAAVNIDWPEPIAPPGD